MINAISRYIVTECCGAPVIQQYNMVNETFPVSCRRCHRVAGVPESEDVGNAADLRWGLMMFQVQIKHMFSYAAFRPNRPFKITGI